MNNLELFNKALKISWQPSKEILEELREIETNLKPWLLRDFEYRRKCLFAEINKKFFLNVTVFRAMLDHIAQKGMILNYHEKVKLESLLNLNDRKGFENWIKSTDKLFSHRQSILKLFTPFPENLTLKMLKVELKNKSKYEVILTSLLGAWVFYSYKKEAVHRYFNDDAGKDSKYFEKYFDHLKYFYPSQVDRRHSATLIEISSKQLENFGTFESLQNWIFEQVSTEFESINNHCYLFVVVKSDLEDKQWRLYSDIVLYAEKFKEVKLNSGYFNPKLIQEKTCSYIKESRIKAASFDIVNEGFIYEDCFVLCRGLDYKYDILLSFIKNQRDETPIPCPACRSKNIQGNSYPTIGVRSWECNNIFCPDRSKYNRGKRYALASIIKQEAIEHKANEISKESTKKWKFDIVNINSDEEYISMIIKHYTLKGDKLKFINTKDYGDQKLNRFISYERTDYKKIYENRVTSFYDSAFFKRFLVLKKSTLRKRTKNMSDVDNVEVYEGDSFFVLQQFASESIDGAVTSPPYYNAREYSTWVNIYTYLYDMYNIITQSQRVLKKGSLFLYNIFDYFDNENIIVESAMGKKRMILGAYMIYLFRKAGFEIAKNIIWDKGEVEGKRNFNQGNNFPYYQKPFNCWEHIFVFSKGKMSQKNKVKVNKLPNVLFHKPVLKMFKGKNILGHSAPYPKAIPNLLIQTLDKKSVVLDPFSGSMTTGRTAYEASVRSINIDYVNKYCKLGLQLLKKENLN